MRVRESEYRQRSHQFGRRKKGYTRKQSIPSIGDAVSLSMCYDVWQPNVGMVAVSYPLRLVLKFRLPCCLPQLLPLLAPHLLYKQLGMKEKQTVDANLDVCRPFLWRHIKPSCVASMCASSGTVASTILLTWDDTFTVLSFSTRNHRLLIKLDWRRGVIAHSFASKSRP